MRRAERASAAPPKITFHLLALMLSSQSSCQDSDLLQPHGPLNTRFQIGRRKRSGGALPVLRLCTLIKASPCLYLLLSSFLKESA